MIRVPSKRAGATARDKEPEKISRSAIYGQIRKIPRGKVATYGQIAALAGYPGHPRQVGYALRGLPDSSTVPWHRVINAQGRISRRGEFDEEFIQRRLLEAEGVRFAGGNKVKLAEYRWEPNERGSMTTAKLGKPESKKVSDAAVKSKTGKTWPQWLTALDRKGAKKMSHKEIVAATGRINPKMGGWWQQMVTVGYEQQRGLRDKHQKPAGYEISGSKTVNASVGKLFESWKDARKRNRWLGEKIKVRLATKNKSLRITWLDGKTDLNVYLYSKEAGKSSVQVQHGKLPSAAAATRMKKYWAKKLGDLKEYLEA